jgi:outer membrane lipopolysaccharide assembly protein LptE/RlpB
MNGRLLRGAGLALMLLLAGCGYHFQGRDAELPGAVHTLYVELLTNATFEPFLENELTNAVVERFSRNPRLQIVEDRNRADAILSGTIASYGNYALAYDQNDAIAEYRSQMSLDAVLRRADNAEALWKGNVAWAEEYSSSIDKTLQDARENAAIQSISERLAEELYSRIVDNF